MEYTENLKLNKPGADDYYSVEHMNENMDKLDEVVSENTKDISAAKEQNALIRQAVGYTKKNLLKNVLESQTTESITYTVGNDGSISTSGTASADKASNSDIIIGSFVADGREYILSGAPEGTSLLGYKLYARNNSGVIIARDYENNGKFTATGTVTVYLGAYKGINMDGLVFYPMIRSADILDNTYEPYVEDVDTRLKVLDTKGNLVQLGRVDSSSATKSTNTSISADTYMQYKYLLLEMRYLKYSISVVKESMIVSTSTLNPFYAELQNIAVNADASINYVANAQLTDNTLYLSLSKLLAADERISVYVYGIE